MKKIVLIGSGNTATVLGRLMKQKGYEISQVISRTIENARTLAIELNASYDVLTASSYEDADLYLIAISDQFLSGLDRYSALHGKFVVHTAGSVSKDVLHKISERYGVLYPLQALSKYMEHYPEIPFLVDGNNVDTLDSIMGFAKTLSSQVDYANDLQRINYHVAAVFCSNFANHMFSLTEIFCQRENIDFKQMLPLIEEVTSKLKIYSPFLTQTGPAMRDDVFTISKHLEALSRYPDIKYMYLKITENIVKLHGKR